MAALGEGSEGAELDVRKSLREKLRMRPAVQSIPLAIGEESALKKFSDFLCSLEQLSCD